MALRTASDLFRRAQRLIPGGVNSPVRSMRAVGLDEPFFVRRAEGGVPRNRGRPAAPRLGLLGSPDLRARRSRDGRRRSRGRPGWDELRRAHRARGAPGGGDRRRGSVGRDGPARLVGHRGGDERDPARPGRDAPTASSSSQVAITAMSTPSWPRRARGRDARDPGDARCADRGDGAHDRLSVQRPRRDGGSRSDLRRRPRLHHRRARAGNMGSFRLSPAFSTV